MTVAALAVAAGLGATANAAEVLDQDFMILGPPGSTALRSGASGLTPRAQYFTAGQTGLLTRVGLALTNTDTSPISIRLFAGLPANLMSAFNQPAIMQGVYTGLDGFTQTLFDVSSLNFFVTAGQRYAIIVGGPGSGSGVTWTIGYDGDGNPNTQDDVVSPAYAGGEAYSIFYPLGEISPLGADRSFRTYVDTAIGGGAVPEPATWAFMIVGFGSIGAVMRRRRVPGSQLYVA